MILIDQTMVKMIGRKGGGGGQEHENIEGTTIIDKLWSKRTENTVKQG